jgi:hypothetical protein
VPKLLIVGPVWCEQEKHFIEDRVDQALPAPAGSNAKTLA